MEKAHIFVAEHDKPFLELIQYILHIEGYRVTLLHTPANAFEEIKQASPDLVILEIVLKHPDEGWKVLEHLKFDPATTNIPVIICSADLRSVSQREEHLSKLRCFTLNKPFAINDLIAKVETALASEPVTADEFQSANQIAAVRLSKTND